MTIEVLGLILARGGSKGIPRKNVRLVGGKPLIAWTIDAARSASGIDRLVVSTDDQEIAGVARQWGAEVPFERPAELARDETGSIETVVHAVEWLAQHQGYRPDYVMLLQPTSPLRTSQDIEAAIQLAIDRHADGVVSVCEVHQHPFWMKAIDSGGVLHDFLPGERRFTRRQDLPPAYYIDGAIYLVRHDVLLEQRTFYTDRTFAYVMPNERTLDVDTPWDLRLADLVLRAPAAQTGA